MPTRGVGAWCLSSYEGRCWPRASSPNPRWGHGVCPSLSPSHPPPPGVRGQRCTPGGAGTRDSLLSSSQGLGAPVGALVGGPKDFIEGAWRLRKALGGGMRQAGVLAAAALVGLADVEEVLLRDHQNARRFAQGARTSCPSPPFAPGRVPWGSPAAGPKSPAGPHPSDSGTRGLSHRAMMGRAPGARVVSQTTVMRGPYH